jgi:serine phosphatase RsbU (regulator of sigma subunit)
MGIPMALGVAARPELLAKLSSATEASRSVITGVDPVTRSRTQLVLELMPFLIMGAVVALALTAGSKQGVLPLLSLGPAFAAVSGGLRSTLVAGGVALVLCALLQIYQNIHVAREDILAFTTVAGVTAAGVIASAGRQRRERELAAVTAIAEVAQQVLLRPVPRAIGLVRLAVRYVSAAEGARIGGDVYEVVTTGSGLRVIIGDVQGKGLPAVQNAATVLGAFREAVHDAENLEVIADRIEASLTRQMTSEQFVTAVLAQVSRDASKIELLNCGHPPPLVVTESSPRFVDTPDPGLPLGLADLGDFPRQSATIGFGPGDMMLLYTDGITEARDKSGEFFPLTGSPRLLADHEPDKVLDLLSGDIARYVGHALDDDATMLLLRREHA